MLAHAFFDHHPDQVLDEHPPLPAGQPMGYLRWCPAFRFADPDRRRLTKSDQRQVGDVAGSSNTPSNAAVIQVEPAPAPLNTVHHERRNQRQQSDLADSAQRLWELLSRVLPLPYRLEALVLLSFAAFAASDFVVALVAAESALADNPEHQMAGLLKTAMAAGLAPQELRRLVRRQLDSSMPMHAERGETDLPAGEARTAKH